MPVLTAHAWIALGTAVGVLLLLATNRLPADIVLLMAMGLLVATGVVEPKQALSGFASEAMISVALLFVVAAAMQRSGAMGLLTRPLLGRPTGPRGAITRMSLPVAGLSGFLNNTPMVAMLMPVISDWGRRIGISPSKLLIPLSYATVLGGMLTMIGTSTNLVVAGMLVQSGHEAPGLLWPTLLAIPMVVVGLAVLIVLGPKLLPDRVPVGGDAFGDHRRFTVEVVVEAGGVLDGRPLREAKVGDRGLMPVEVVRGEDVIPAPGPELVLHGGDRLALAGPAVSVVAVHRVAGLSSAVSGRLVAPSGRRRMFEVVVSDRCPLVGQPTGTGAFRARYGGAIIAIARHGAMLQTGRPGDWVLRPGDTLLVEARSAFAADPAHERDFWMVTEREDARPGTSWKSWAAMGITVAMCGAAAFGICSMLWAALAAVIALVVFRVMSVSDARSAVDLPVLVSIAASMSIGFALERSGAAEAVAHGIALVGGDQPWVALTLIYVTTAVVTEMITNNAAAALLLPIGLAMAQHLGVSWQPFAAAVMFAASASFATPIGYQTNLMVWGPGGYRFSDFVKLGGVMQIAVGIVTIGLAPLVFPFRP